jgi:isopentenyl phosphate kinase
MPDLLLDPNLVFIKLGGSLITDKDRPETPDVATLTNLLREIALIREENPGLKVLLGHGSGSFGHHVARQAGTRKGVFSVKDWQGYQAVWLSARRLNQIVVEACHQSGLPVLSFPPSASVLTKNHAIQTWELAPITSALLNGLIPLVYGDVVTDLSIGGTILSTEDLFFHLALALRPSRILLAGEEEAVYADYPQNKQPLNFISRDEEPGAYLQGSASLDVTGGMLSKVRLMQSLCMELPGLSSVIFSGRNPKNLARIMAGESVGTTIA